MPDRRRTHIATLGVILATFALVGAACGGDDDASDDGASPEGQSTVQDQATATSPAPDDSGSAELPDGFPQDFPFPGEFTLTEAEFTEGDDFTQPNFLLRGTSTLSPAEIATFYHERLPEAGYEVQGPPPSPDATNPLVYFQGEDVTDASVQASTDGEITNVIISLPLRD